MKWLFSLILSFVVAASAAAQLVGTWIRVAEMDDEPEDRLIIRRDGSFVRNYYYRFTKVHEVGRLVKRSGNYFLAVSKPKPAVHRIKVTQYLNAPALRVGQDVIFASAAKSAISRRAKTKASWRFSRESELINIVSSRGYQGKNYVVDYYDRKDQTYLVKVFDESEKRSKIIERVKRELAKFGVKPQRLRFRYEAESGSPPG